jgi:hypothetical protein
MRLGLQLRSEKLACMPSIGEWWGEPCAIDGKRVFSIRRVGLLGRNQFDVCLGNARYRHLPETGRPLDEAIAGVERAAREYLQRRTAHLDHLPEFKSVLGRVFEELGARTCEGHLVLYADDDYQVQFAEGTCGLIRGPLACEKGPVYVGMRIVGAGRREWLARPPIVGRCPNLLWTRSGVPPCMGSPQQYQHLCSNELTDTQALAGWVEAAAIVMAGVPSARRRLALRAASLRRI